jgi:hypothetical protein
MKMRRRRSRYFQKRRNPVIQFLLDCMEFSDAMERRYLLRGR